MKVELTAFGAGQTPVLDGKIPYVSADSEKASAGGGRYYLAKASVSWKDKQTMIPGAVVPGMPVTTRSRQARRHCFGTCLIR